ncbi:MAG: hypothetical protein ABSH15_11205 [Verrucomicrobiota bacterium]
MRVLTSEEIRQVEYWARNTQIAKILSFFDEFPRFIHAPQPFLIGSNNESEILIAGDTTVSRIREALRHLDEPFNPHLKEQKFLGGIKREKPEKAFPTLYQELRKGLTEVCLLEDTGECDGKIIRAHSLQKSLFRRHAKNGHVYQFDPFTGQHDANRNLWPDLIGINEATTFLGFCKRHDSQVFSPIEDVSFQNTPEQKFLHHYRAFAQMYYDKAYKFKIIKNVFIELAKKFSPSELNILAKTIYLNQHDVDELKEQKLRLDVRLQKKDWSTVEGCAFLGDKMPEILTANFFAPRKNFHGLIFQDTKSLLSLKWISFTVTATNDRALFLLCGEKGCPVLHEFVKSFREMPLQTNAIVTYVFCAFENFILLPEWWESLSKDVQKKFVNAYQGRYYRRELPNTADWKLKELVP